MMNLHIHYLTDQKGKHTAVQIPDHEWKAFLLDYQKTKNKLDILLGIQDALNEVREIQKGRRKGKSLRDALNEL